MLTVFWKSGKKTVNLTADDAGRTVVKLPPLARGKHSLTVRFTDRTGTLDDGVASALTLTVT
jgi:hypothetical protein